jgi:hypothetical protein
MGVDVSMRNYINCLLASIMPGYFITESRLRPGKAKTKLEFIAFVDRYNPPSLWDWRVTLAPKFDCETFVVIRRSAFRRSCGKGEVEKCGRMGVVCYFIEK